MRAIATVTVLFFLLIGTFFGDDDAFPFGPFRMYSIANRTSGEIRIVRIEGAMRGSSRSEIAYSEFGLRRAEVEGQLQRFIADPDDLALLAEAYRNANPEDPPLTELYLVHEIHRLEDGRPVSERRMLLARWSRS